MKKFLLGLLTVLACGASLEAYHVNVYVGGGGGWHHPYYHSRVYYGDAWYHPDHVYFYGGDPYATYYNGAPYYCCDPRWYWYQ